MQWYYNMNSCLLWPTSYPYYSCGTIFHLQDFYVADASENQVFLAVAHSARTTHLYISDTSGTKYSLSMERVLYFSQNTSSAWLRWQMITLHIYFFKKLKWFSSLLTYIVFYLHVHRLSHFSPLCTLYIVHTSALGCWFVAKKKTYQYIQSHRREYYHLVKLLYFSLWMCCPVQLNFDFMWSLYIYIYK